MAVRIYALAKELKLDSKDLVDICTRAGVTGKGSALASLTDEEVVKVKAFLATPPRSAAPPAMAPPPMKPPTKAPLAPVRPAAPTAPTAPTTLRREDYLAPAGTAPSKPPALPTKPSEKPPLEVRKKSSGEEPSKPAIRVPNLKLAPVPPSQPGAGGRKSDEPAPQKPDLKLPLDAIRASKAGSKPLQEHLRKHEQRRKTEGAEPAARPGGPPRSGAGARPPADAPLILPGGRDRVRRGKVPGAPDEPEKEGALVGREGRQLKRRRAPVRRREGDEEVPVGAAPARHGPRSLRRTGTNTAAPRKSHVVVQLPCTVRSFSEAIGVPAQRVLGKLLQLGMPTNINAELATEAAELLAVELGVDVEIRQPVSLEQQVLGSLEAEEEREELLLPRPPVVTFLGHVDHGKTSLLDRIIGTNVARGESGGITQHIRAYRIDKDGRSIAFVDTPGHEAFTAMRARGAHVTDIAVLVVAADDGVMPQTEEAISHARAAEVPIVVALNKIDLPGVNMDRLFQQLSTAGLQPTQWGGEIEVIPCSAHTGKGVDDLLETLLTVAELEELKANPERAAAGTCLEAELSEGRGVVAKVIVQKGTLHVGDVMVCGTAYGRVKAMYDTLQPSLLVESAGPSTPVNVTGLSEAPAAGEHFHILEGISQARQIAQQRALDGREAALRGPAQHVTLENLFERLGKADEVQTLNLILRADVRGSIEAIQKELTKLQHPEVKLRILQATVGGITEADVHLADASDAIIIGFNVVPDEKARVLADQKGVQVRRYDIIYQVTDDMKLALEGLLRPERREVDSGRALVLRLFQISRVGTVVGCRVLSGTIERSCRIRVIRDNRVLGDYALDSLRREKDDAREVREGFECGIKLANFNDLKEGDVLEAYKIEEVARTI